MNDHTEKLDDLMDRYLFGLLDAQIKQRVRHKIETDPEWQIAYEAAFQRRAVLDRLAQADLQRASAAPKPNIQAIVDAAEGIGRRMRRINIAFGSLAAAVVLMVAGAWLPWR